MAKNKRGASAPRFFYLENRRYFTVKEHPSNPGFWFVANMNGAIMSERELPMIYNGPNGALVDALGCSTSQGFTTKIAAEKKADEFNERVIDGWSVWFDDKTIYQRAWDSVKESVLFWTLTGMIITSLVVSAVWAIVELMGK